MKFIVFILLIFDTFYVFSQNELPRFKHLRIEDGLSQSSVTTIYQDYKGYIWIGTEDGLNRYDGYNFKIYKHEDNNQSLCDNYIIAIFEDSHQRLWFGTNGGLAIYNRDFDSFINLKHNPIDSLSLPSNYINTIFEDSQNNIWIATDAGLAKLIKTDNQNFLFTTIHPKGYKTKEKKLNILSISEISDGQLYLGTNQNCLFLFETSSLKFTPIEFYTNNQMTRKTKKVFALEVDEFSNLYIGTGQGLWILPAANEKKDLKAIRFNEYFKLNKQVPDDNIHALFRDKNNKIWIGTNQNGAYRFEPEIKELQNIRHDENNIYSLNSNKVLCVFEDNAKVLWFGTFGGISLYDMKTERFNHYFKKIEDKNSLLHNYIWAFHEDQNGLIWIGTHEGLNIFNKKENTFKTLNSSASLKGYTIKAISQSPDGVYWIGFYRQGVTKISLKDYNKYGLNNFIIKRYTHNKDKQNSLSNDKVWALDTDTDGKIWIGTSSGLDCFDPKTETFTHYRYNPKDTTSLSYFEAYMVYVDPKNNVWVGTDKALDLFDRHSKTFIHFANNPNNTNSLSNNTILAILRDKAGIYWVGTANGLNKIVFKNYKSKSFDNYEITRYSKSDGLPNDFIYGILEDSHGNLWLSTNKGISKFDRKTETFINYYEDDGLQSNEFNAGAFLKDSDGNLYFGGINGFNVFHPDSIMQEQGETKVVINDFRIFNHSITPKKLNGRPSPLQKQITQADIIKLTHKDYVISFEFAALEFSVPEKINYAYKMENFDKEWNNSESRRFCTYTNLPAGDYEFIVKATNADGIWNKNYKSVKISIKPPYWQTWWFRTGLIVLGLILIYVWNRMRTYRIQKQKSKLEVLVRKRTKELVEQKEKIELAYEKVKMLSNIGNEISSILDLEQIIDNVFDKINELIEASVLSIGLYNSENECIEFNRAKENYKTLPFYQIPLSKSNESLAVWCFINQKEILINEFTKEYKQYIPKYKRRQNIEIAESVLYIPLNVKDKKIGVISVQNLKPNTYNDNHKNMLRNIAIYTAIAIDNANAYIEIGRQANELKSYNQRLKEKQEEILQQAEVLRETNEEINSKNEELELHRTKLEQIVEERTHELLKAKIKAEESDKLKTAFLANMSHEIRTPLNAILGFSSLITEYELTAKQKKEYFDHIDISAKSLLHLIDDIIEVSKIESGEITIKNETFNVKAFLQDIFLFFKNNIHINEKKELELIFDNFNDNDDTVFKTDKIRLRQIIDNLLSNAIKYTENGSIKFGYKIIKKHEKRQFIRFYVEDTGIGIPEDKLEIIFDRFTKIEGSKVKLYRGAGLGLAIAKKLTRMLDGKIWAKSTVGQGTVFYIQFVYNIKYK